MARIALKVDVDTLRGTREGVPRLLDIFAKAGVAATFLFSLGPDHTGWALRRVFRPGFLRKVSRTSVLSHYGLRTLMYGVLLPAPDIGRQAAAPMRAARDAGHECGIHTWDHVLWQDNVRHRDADWTRRQMTLAMDRFVAVFGAAPATHGAAGWQMNEAAFRQLDAWRLPYASDGRGSGPYRPSIGGVALAHVQLPTTLPTFDELIGRDGIDAGNVAAAVARATAGRSGEGDGDQGDGDRGDGQGDDGDSGDHVFTLHAELEGGLFAPAFDHLLAAWRSQGHELVTLGCLHAAVDTKALPVRPVAWGSVAGRSGELIVQ